MKPGTLLRAATAIGLGIALACAASGTSLAALDEPDRPDRGEAPDLGLMLTAGELEGSPVLNVSGEEIARVEGLFIDPKSGQVELVALKFVPEGTIKALPWSALAFTEDQPMLDATEIQIEQAPVVDASMLARKSPSSGGTASPTPAEPEPVAAMRGYAPLTAYEQRFDPSNMDTLEGVVRGTVRAPIGKSKTVDEIAFLETSPGTSVLLALAPNWYLQKEGVHLDPTETITVTGSRVDSDVGELLVVTSIRTGDREVQLRTSLGAPLWKR